MILKQILRRRKTTVTVLAFAVLTLTGQTALAQDNSMAKINAKGELARPENYREWVYVGTPLTPNELNSGKAAFPEFHNVYIDPVSWKAFKKTGAFPDGTIIVKELVSVGSKTAVSGNGYFMGEYLGLEATVKSKKHFPDEPNNWAYFSFGKQPNLTATAKAFETAMCAACHQAAAAQDMVFTQYYPVLRAAKK